MNKFFQFSQSSLQTFLDCQKKYELRYIEKLDWPALQIEDAQLFEERIELGNAFHRLAHQYHSGLPAEILEKFIKKFELVNWWENFIGSDFLKTLNTTKRSEYTISAQFNNSRLIAKYDLLTVDQENKLLILDWKTSFKKPARHFIQDKVQTRLYPFLLVLARETLPFPVEGKPENIKMTYWYPEFPDEPEIFPYSSADYEADETLFRDLINEIKAKPKGEFQRTSNEKICKFCNFRSYCDLGKNAGSLEQADLELAFEDLDLNLDLDLEL